MAQRGSLSHFPLPRSWPPAPPHHSPPAAPRGSRLERSGSAHPTPSLHHPCGPPSLPKARVRPKTDSGATNLGDARGPQGWATERKGRCAGLRDLPGPSQARGAPLPPPTGCQPRGGWDPLLTRRGRWRPASLSASPSGPPQVLGDGCKKCRPRMQKAGLRRSAHGLGSTFTTKFSVGLN